MTNKILLKRSVTPGASPTSGGLVIGEVAINAADAVLYTQNTIGEVQPVVPGALTYTHASSDDGGSGIATLDGVVSYATRPGDYVEDMALVKLVGAVMEFYRKQAGNLTDSGFGIQNPPVWRFRGDVFNIEIIEGKLYKTQVDAWGYYLLKEEIGAGAAPEFLTGLAYWRNTLSPNATVPVHGWQAKGNEANIDLLLAAKGTGAILAQAPDNTATGGNKRGARAVDWQMARTAATQVASGDYSTISGGGHNTASGQCSAIPGGKSATTNGLLGLLAYGFNGAASGQNQMAFWGGRLDTTNATATRITADAAAASASNQLALRNNSAFRVRGTVVARNTSTNDCKEWTFEALIKRGASAAATAIVGTPSITSTFADAAAASWGIAVTADTTNGALAVTATGAASTTIRWTAVVHSIEVA